MPSITRCRCAATSARLLRARVGVGVRDRNPNPNPNPHPDQVRGDLCERRLIEVTLLPHEAPDPHAGGAEPSAEVHAATWPVEEERVYVSDPLAPGGWRQWATQDYERHPNPTPTPTPTPGPEH